ncbi:MAG: hypothetical protein WC538_00220 [Thermoanaerobaculia bacterium]|jgi:hypothetical protein
MHRRVPCITILLVALTFAAPSSAEVRASDLEGHWLSSRYIDALDQTRSLTNAAEIAIPLEVAIEPFGAGYRLFVSSFHEATWSAIVRVDQGEGDRCTLALGPYETVPVPSSALTKVAATLVRDRYGRVEKMQMAIWGEENVEFRRIEMPAEQFVNTMLLAGAWRDLDGGHWSFDPKGTLTRPDGKVVSYSPSIDTSEACCDYLTIDGTRTGFALRDDTLWMYREFEDPEGCPISCDKTKPLHILIREVAGDAKSPVALTRVKLAPLSKDGATWGASGRQVAVSLNNADGKADPEIFTEPPFVVTDRRSGAHCEIDGGIWERNAIWLSADESLLATVTFSGSNSTLSVYRTRDCKETASAPVDESTLRVDADRLEHTGICEPYGEDSWDCFPAAIWRLGRDGSLDLLAEESARLTSGVFGVAFTGRSDIEHARTDRATLKPASR